jgi:2-polyprenyl-6-methoxyphenol hydroxylase-like FAD-dependent oxidoreductase
MAGPDVVIVGGGIVGSALAARLSRGGLDVLVLERQELQVADAFEHDIRVTGARSDTPVPPR